LPQLDARPHEFSYEHQQLPQFEPDRDLYTLAEEGSTSDASKQKLREYKKICSEQLKLLEAQFTPDSSLLARLCTANYLLQQQLHKNSKHSLLQQIEQLSR
jgi:hypothetical protein